MDPGTVIDDRFEILSVVRGGAMGDALRARDRTTDHTVAVRLVAADARDRSAIAADGLVRVVGAGAGYLALAWIDGDTAIERRRRARLTLHGAVRIGAAVARTLAALHAHGVGHGAVAAGHVVIDDGGGVTLLEPSAGAAAPRDDLGGLGRLLVRLIADVELTAPLRPRSAPLPPALAVVVDDLLAGATLDAAAAAARLDGLDRLDDVTPLGDATIDLHGAAPIAPRWLEPEPTPDLDRDRDAGAGLVVKATDRYQLQGVVGQGGLGRVVLAHDRELDRVVAIKELLRRTPISVARFRREALVTARLQHPGIVPIHDAGRWPNGAPFYAMKLVEGDDLAHLIAAADDLAARLALLPKVIAVCEAMAYAHAQRIIHRDLKPGNVVVGEFGEAMIVDWGLAKELDAGDLGGADDGDELYRGATDDGLTRAGDVVGTPAYMAPEQARGDAVDCRTDVYALGAILYHLLAGRAPYAEATTSSTAAGFRRRGAREVRAEPPPPLAAQVADLPIELLAIVGKAMARDPAARYPTALELAHELRRFEAGQLVSAHRYTPRQLVRRWAGRHRAALVAAAVLAIAVIAIGAVAIVRIVGAEQIAQRERATAIAAGRRADDARAAAEAEGDRLRVLQAEQALARDPTEALDWLAITASLPPALHARAAKVATEAVGRGVAFARHQLPGPIIALASAGDRVAAISTGGTAAVWTRAGVELRRVALGAPGAAIALSADGAQLVVTTDDRRARWWRDDTAAPIVIALPAAAAYVEFVDDDHVMMALADGAVVPWFAGGAIRSHPVLADEPSALIALDGEVVVAGHDGALARVGLDAVRWRIRGHDGAIHDAVVDADGSIVTAGADGTIRRWRGDGTAIDTIAIGPALARVAIDGDAIVALADEPPTRYRWRAATGVVAEPLGFRGRALCTHGCAWQVASAGPQLRLARGGDRATLDGHRDTVEDVVAAGPDAIVSGDRVGEVRFWRAPIAARVVPGHASSAPAATPTGWVVGLATGEVVAIDPDARPTVIGRLPGPVARVAARHDVVAAATDTRVMVWRGGRIVVDAAAAQLVRLWLSDDGDHVSVLADRGRVWSTRTGRVVAEVADARELVVVAGRRVYALGAAAIVAIDLDDATAARVSYPLPFAPILAAARPDGGVVLASAAGQLQLIDARGHLGATAELAAEVQSIAADRDWIYLGGVDGVVRAWRPADDARRTLAAGHDRWIHGLDPAADRLTSWSRAAPSVRLWRLTDGATRYLAASDRVLGAAFGPTPDRLLVTDRSGAMRVIDAPIDALDRIAPGGLSRFVARHQRPLPR